MKQQGILLGAGTNEMELLTVWIYDQLFGINVAKVQSVQAYDRKLVTPMPENPPGVMGMMLYRERTIPILDLELLLDMAKKGDKKNDREIVVVTEFNNTVNAFKAHGVNRILRFSWAEFSPINRFIGSDSYVTGSVQADEHEIMVLDLEQVLATVFPGMVLESVSEETMQRKEKISRNQLNILFAEDSFTIRKGVIKVLKQAGFEEITSFENGQDACDYCMKHADDFADTSIPTVVISDIEMPKMDGLTLCRKLKQDPVLKDLYVIIFSSLINTQMIQKCQQVSADRYVTKPETNALIEILDEFCSN
ncbi:Similar to CheW like chemotaxis response regulatory protein [Desulfamplus magnetovallimortis]|uniref:Similar to CheW like chemotaxis response regulatory protein n=1 Tax=Desulfamplus magnetovallimortis TaxID=1246637 RepID=A0A1W1HJQ7_9BACT|nr:chemotaxis protein [Desulfamplus magnetovallimortis]SLM32598.1 Similar to CheW like chemotaxis response regulatory protein [Desulfamplus magnetovallimortis]